MACDALAASLQTSGYMVTFPITILTLTRLCLKEGCSDQRHFYFEMPE
jgi:hypothetical protein